MSIHRWSVIYNPEGSIWRSKTHCFCRTLRKRTRCQWLFRENFSRATFANVTVCFNAEDNAAKQARANTLLCTRNKWVRIEKRSVTCRNFWRTAVVNVITRKSTNSEKTREERIQAPGSKNGATGSNTLNNNIVKFDWRDKPTLFRTRERGRLWLDFFDT